jgi:hypothetical protein
MPYRRMNTLGVTPVCKAFPAGLYKLKTAYTVYFNRRHQVVGHLFQGRFKSTAKPIRVGHPFISPDLRSRSKESGFGIVCSSGLTGSPRVGISDAHQPALSRFELLYARACCSRSRKNVLSIRSVWLVAIPISGLAFGTFGSILLGKFNFIRPKSDPTRRRSFSRERSNEPSPLAAKSKYLVT